MRDTRLALRAAGWIAVALSLRAVAVAIDTAQAVADRAVAAVVDRLAPPIPAELRAWVDAEAERFAMSSSTRRSTDPMCSGASNDVDFGEPWREVAS